MTTYPSGQQYELVDGGQHATIVEVGAGIRTYEVGGRPVLQPYPVEAICDGAHGTPLIPWPNRLADGRYSFDGADYQLPLTEPEKHNAIHGLLRWRPWQVKDQSTRWIVMTTRLHPQPGYPFLLDVEVEYRLTSDGLRTTTTATNRGDTACPYGCGQHPYLSAGNRPLDDCTLQLPARTRIETDPTRQLPTGTEPVTGTPYDFRTARPIGDLRIDYAFTDLNRDPDGLARVRLTRPDGSTVELWVDSSYPLVEIFTGDTLAPDRARRGLGTEPMTCPPNAFQNGDQVHRLQPGHHVRTTWGVRLC